MQLKKLGTIYLLYDFGPIDKKTRRSAGLPKRKKYVARIAG
jgi:hypothetical protein